MHLECGDLPVTCMTSCIVSRVSRIDFSRFSTDCEDYITVDHAVDRSLLGERTLCWYVGLG